MPELDVGVGAFDEDGDEDVEELQAVATRATVVSPMANRLALRECRILGAPLRVGRIGFPLLRTPSGRRWRRDLPAVSG